MHSSLTPHQLIAVPSEVRVTLRMEEEHLVDDIQRDNQGEAGTLVAMEIDGGSTDQKTTGMCLSTLRESVQ